MDPANIAYCFLYISLAYETVYNSDKYIALSKRNTAQATSMARLL